MLLTPRSDLLFALLNLPDPSTAARAERCGYSSRSGAWNAAQKALKESVAEATAEQRQLAALTLDRAAIKLWEIIRGEHVHVSAGRIVLRDGRPVRDAKPIIDAIGALIKLEERRARLLGLDVPRRSAVEVITNEMIDEEIARLEADLARREAPDSHP